MQQTDVFASRKRPRATPLTFTALMALLPLAAAGDAPSAASGSRVAPSPGKVFAPAPAGKIGKDARATVDVTFVPKRSLPSLKQFPGQHNVIITTAPGIRGLIVPVPESERSAVIQRDLLYRGEDVGPYHPLYLQGVPPGTRIKGVNPPPLRQTPRLQLITPARTRPE